MSFERKDGPVVVRSIMVTKEAGMKQVSFVQERLKALDKMQNVLSLFMLGDTRFGSPFQKIVTFQTMTEQSMQAFGLTEGGAFPESWNPRIVVHEFCEGDVIPESIRSLYDNASIFRPRAWEGGQQLPKLSAPVKGKRQVVLTRLGKPIYRQTHLVIADMDHNDYLIQHDNKVAGVQDSAEISEPISEYVA